MTAAAGCLAKAQDFLRATLAGSAMFKTWVDADDVDGALASIYMEGLPAPAAGAAVHTLLELQTYRPFAVVWTQENAGFQRTRKAVGTWRESGRLCLRLVQDTPAAVLANKPEADLLFKNTIGQIIDQMCDLAGGAGYLDIDTIAVDDGPYRTHPDAAADEGDAQGIDLGITYGGAL